MIDFGDGCDGRLAAAAGYSLFDRDAGRQAFDGIHIRLFELFHKLPCIRRHTVQKRRWPSANKMSKASVDLPDPLSPVITTIFSGDVKRHILEIVFTCPRSRIAWEKLPADARAAGCEPILDSAAPVSQSIPKKASGVGSVARGNLLGSSCGHHPTALIASLRTQIDDPIRALDHLEIVLNDNQTSPSSTRR